MKKPDVYFTNELGQRCIKRGRTILIERTKDFYIKDGDETKPEYLEAIRRRENMGGKLPVIN